eukprot:gene17216-biopygen5950
MCTAGTQRCAWHTMCLARKDVPGAGLREGGQTVRARRGPRGCSPTPRGDGDAELVVRHSASGKRMKACVWRHGCGCMHMEAWVRSRGYGEAWVWRHA